MNSFGKTETGKKPGTIPMLQSDSRVYGHNFSYSSKGHFFHYSSFESYPLKYDTCQDTRKTVYIPLEEKLGIPETNGLSKTWGGFMTVDALPSDNRTIEKSNTEKKLSRNRWTELVLRLQTLVNRAVRGF